MLNSSRIKARHHGSGGGYGDGDGYGGGQVSKIKPFEQKLSNVFNVVSRKKDGSFVGKRSYFYRMGLDTSKLKARLLELIPEAIVIDEGDHWHAFVGGAASGSAKDSYMWVQFKLNS